MEQKDFEKQAIEEMRKDLVEIFDEEFEKRRIITADFTAIKMSAKGYRKQKEGEWKHPPYAPFGGSYEMKRCSICGYKPDFDSDNPYTKFCPNCGAKMKGGSGYVKKTDERKI